MVCLGQGRHGETDQLMCTCAIHNPPTHTTQNTCPLYNASTQVPVESPEVTGCFTVRQPVDGCVVSQENQNQDVWTQLRTLEPVLDMVATDRSVRVVTKVHLAQSPTLDAPSTYTSTELQCIALTIWLESDTVHSEAMLSTESSISTHVLHL